MNRLITLLLDLALVTLFATIGRASHKEDLTPAGIVSTAWPFLVACLISWIAVTALKRHGDTMPTGVIVWSVTVIGGLGLRLASGNTAELPFVIVTTIALAVLLLGWRLIARLLAGPRMSARPSVAGQP